MRAFVRVNNVGMMINVDANVKNWLIKVCVVKDMLEILVIVSVNVINHTMLMADKLVEEWNENIDEAILAGIALFEHGNESVCY